MKTILFITLLSISAISFAQSKNQKLSNSKHTLKASFVRPSDLKVESNVKSDKRTIKIGGTEKPYARTTNANGQNSRKWWVNKKMKESNINNSYNQRRREDVKISDVKLPNQRKRVIVAKSNKQGDPNSN